MLGPSIGSAQYPSPTMQNMTVLGTLTLLGPLAGAGVAGLATGASVTAEANRATAAEAVVAASVTAETSRALIAEGVNATAITTETTARIAAVNGEATARVAGDTANTSAISTEASTARGAEAAALPKAGGTMTGLLVLSGGEAQTVRNVTAASYTASSADRFICVAPTAATTITLVASPTTGLIQTVNDCTGVARTFNITVQPASGTMLTSYTNVLMNQNNESIDFEYTGSTWVIR